MMSFMVGDFAINFGQSSKVCGQGMSLYVYNMYFVSVNKHCKLVEGPCSALEFCGDPLSNIQNPNAGEAQQII